DTAHQAIVARRGDGPRTYEVIEAECVGCNLCHHICPVTGCITMQPQTAGLRQTWQDHPNNPLRQTPAVPNAEALT
ncbi:MAG: hypothetical protein B7X01_00445, partial [Acidiphilium sp. 21-62-4]